MGTIISNERAARVAAIAAAKSVSTERQKALPSRHGPRHRRGMDANTPTEILDRLAQEIREHLDRGAELITRGAEEWIAAGGKLAEARELCGHGQWKPWVDRHFKKGSYRTAMDYINMHRRFAGKGAIVADLPGQVLRMLAAPSTPQAVVDTVIDRKAAGQTITAPLVKREIDKATSTRAEQELEAQSLVAKKAAKAEARSLAAKKAAAKAAMRKPPHPAHVACIDSVRSTVMTHARSLSRKDRACLFGDLRDAIIDIEAHLAATI
jgi:hypothetical protein